MLMSSDAPAVEITQNVKSILIGVLELSIAADEIADDEPLYSAVLPLDSLSTLKLIAALEERFSIRVEDDVILENGFDTVANLVAIVVCSLRAT